MLGLTQAQETNMDESEKIVAAIYAATASLTKNVNPHAFLGHYEAFMAALNESQASTKKAEDERNIETWTKTGR
jgi:hypothetical protein